MAANLNIFPGKLIVYLFCSLIDTFQLFASMSTKQWLQIEVGNEIAMHFLLFLISRLGFKLLFVPIEANS